MDGDRRFRGGTLGADGEGLLEDFGVVEDSGVAALKSGVVEISGLSVDVVDSGVAAVASWVVDILGTGVKAVAPGGGEASGVEEA